MKWYIPGYYKKFQCIAQQCKDNCCIGWDIMIDERSYEQYQKVTTAFKKSLDQGIQHGEEPQFCMDEHGRCAFLNENNLCDIYIELGEAALCEICTQHPRFHNEYGHIRQSGLGLACEEAARFILNDPDYEIVEDILESEDEEDEWADELIQIEMRLLRILHSKEHSIEEKIDQVFDLAAAYQNEINLTGELSVQIDPDKIQPQHLISKMSRKDYLEYWFDFYDNLDYMDTTFQILLKETASQLETCTQYHKNDQYIERLLYYFICRHFMKAYEDDNLTDKVKFAVLSVLMIMKIDQYTQKYDRPFDILDIARMYSKEIEYSQENMEEIFEELLFTI